MQRWSTGSGRLPANDVDIGLDFADSRRAFLDWANANTEALKMSFDLSAYLRRIGWSGGTDPTLDTLRGLVLALTGAIPFENFDVLLGRPIRLDIDSVQEKLVERKRGGYCFEHVTLFATALEHLGFAHMRHTARVVLFAPPTAAPRAHAILKVRVGSRTYLADPGIGAFVPRVPVPLLNEPAQVPAEAIDGIGHTMQRDGRYTVLRIHTPEGVRNGWVTTFDADNLVDFEVGNHFTSTHPRSPFVNNVMLQAITKDGRVTAMNRDVKIWRNGTAREARIETRAELRRLVGDHFGFDLPEIERLVVPAVEGWG
jgi:N-hydroxyarylamine O-acetyltransferase